MEIQDCGAFKIAYRGEGTDDAELLRYFLETDCDLKNIPEYNPKEDHIIIDVGAHIGVFSVFAASKLKKGSVFAIEPAQGNFEFLKRNVAINNFSNIYISKIALAGCKGTSRLSLSASDRGHSITKTYSSAYEEVETDTLTNFLNVHNIWRCDFLKLNCEGAEFPIILGTPKEMLKRIKTIFIKYHLDCVDGYSEKDLISYLRACGFFCTLRYKDRERGWIIASKAIPVFIISRLHNCYLYGRRLRARFFAKYPRLKRVILYVLRHKVP